MPKACPLLYLDAVEPISKWRSLNCGEHLGEPVLRRVFSSIATAIVVEPLEVHQVAHLKPRVSVPVRCVCGCKVTTKQQCSDRLALSLLQSTSAIPNASTERSLFGVYVSVDLSLSLSQLKWRGNNDGHAPFE